MTKGFAKAIPSGKPGPVIAVDLDGTLAEYHGDIDENVIGHPNPVAIAKVNEMKRAGCRIVIFTCREDNELLRGWLAQAGVPYDAINENPDMARAEMGSGKVMADVYWDDRAVNAAEGLDAIANLMPEGYSRNKLLTARGDKPGIVMLELPPQVVAAVRSDQARILPETMTGDGLEEWPHITLLYGIVGVPISEVVEQVRRLDAIDVTFGQSSAFSGEVDVLKIEVHGEPIHAARAKLDAVLPVEHTYPDYQPHVTLAELVPGTLYESRNNLIGAAATLTHAVVVVGDQRVRVPLRMTGLAVTAPQATPVMDDFRTVSLAKAQNIVDRALPMFADYQADQFEAKLSAIESNVAEFMKVQREQSDAMAKAMSGFAAGAIGSFYTDGVGSFAKFNANQPGDSSGKWVSSSDVGSAVGSVAKMKDLFTRLKGDEAEKLVALLQENGASEADAKQAMQEATAIVYTGKFKPDAAKLAEATGAA